MDWTGINKVLDSFKSRPGIKDRLKAQIIKTYFKEEVGIENVSFENGKLEIRVSSPVLLQELFLRREEIKEEINKFLKEEVVKEISLKRG